jgi:hypothetical protein
VQAAQGGRLHFDSLREPLPQLEFKQLLRRLPRKCVRIVSRRAAAPIDRLHVLRHHLPHRKDAFLCVRGYIVMALRVVSRPHYKRRETLEHPAPVLPFQKIAAPRLDVRWQFVHKRASRSTICFFSLFSKGLKK